MAVTGNVLPLELESAAQRFYEAYGGLGRGFERRAVDGPGSANSARRCRRGISGPPPMPPSARRSSADPAIGLMDEALGPGMPSGVGEDTYLFYKILKAGHRFIYEPAAYVWHRHRRTLAELRTADVRLQQGARRLSPHDVPARPRRPRARAARATPALARPPAIALGVAPAAGASGLSALAHPARDLGSPARSLEPVAVAPPVRREGRSGPYRPRPS